MLKYYMWCHAIGIHMYFIPSLIVLAALGIGFFRYRKYKKKLRKEMEEKECSPS